MHCTTLQVHCRSQHRMFDRSYDVYAVVAIILCSCWHLSAFVSIRKTSIKQIRALELKFVAVNAHIQVLEAQTREF